MVNEKPNAGAMFWGFIAKLANTTPGTTRTTYTDGGPRGIIFRLPITGGGVRSAGRWLHGDP